jgi:hypothetical protein
MDSEDEEDDPNPDELLNHSLTKYGKARPLSCCRLPVAGFFSKPFKIIIHELELFEVGY